MVRRKLISLKIEKLQIPELPRQKLQLYFRDQTTHQITLIILQEVIANGIK
jgi:hypothetical protein